MGARGLEAYRYRRRYYTKYHCSDSHFDSLGAGLVLSVPTDPTQFMQWTDKLKKKLEKRYQKWIAEMKSIEANEEGTAGWSPKCPFTMRAPTPGHSILYTYVFDLDRNVFTVNDVAHFPLDAIPRNDEWIEAVEDDGQHARSLSLNPTVPPPDPRLLALYDNCHAILTPKLLKDDGPFPFHTCGVLMDYFFRQFRFVYSPLIDCIKQYEPNHPDFLALVQGVLVLATWGQFQVSADSYYAFDDSEYPVQRFEPEWADPALHDADTYFWYFSTLVVLDVGLDDEQRLRSAVGKTLDLWRASSRPCKNATAFIISLKSVVAVCVSNEAVSHSPPIDLLGTVTASQPRFLTFAHTPGFELLKRHFTPSLPAPVYRQLKLPYDVIENIFNMCDDATLSTFTHTCKTLRTLCLARPRFRIGRYQLLSHVVDNEFTALDKSGRSVPTVLGKFGCAVKGTLPVDYGHALVLNLPAEDADQVQLEFMGLRCLSKAHAGAGSMELVEAPCPESYRMPPEHTLSSDYDSSSDSD